jgi:hypothetical protein
MILIMKNITLTIDEIHSIREEHSQRTEKLNFEEYRRLLDAEIAPVLLVLAHAKEEGSIDK